jgi:molybdopterin molybdotransferase
MFTELDRPLRASVLAGGASRRLGVDKPEERVGGRRLLDVALAAVADADAVVVVIGATGRGVADHLRGAIARARGVVVVDGVAMRPGGSMLVAKLPGSRVLLGLGGNPLAAVAGAVLLGPAVVDALTGSAPAPVELIPVCGFRPTNRWRIVPVEPGGAQGWLAPDHAPTSHSASLVGRRGLALIPPDASEGALVERLA